VRPLVTAFALGAAAAAAAALVLALAAAVLADASGRETFRLAPLGLELVSFRRAAAESSTTFGAGLALLPLVGGLANAAGAAVLRSRRGVP
jgi:hypothetical protein